MREGIYQENEAYGIQRIIKKRSEGRKKKKESPHIIGTTIGILMSR